MNDQNKTQLTHEVTQAACAWLDGAGHKPVETEVVVGRRWIADIAGILCPTRTEAIKLKLLPPRPRFGMSKTGDDSLWWKAWRALPPYISSVIEVKTSRPDFFKDKRKWELPPVADLRWLAVPVGLVGPEEYPPGWGVLLFNGAGLRVVQSPVVHLVSDRQRLIVAQAVAVRRDHHTRYARFREQDKNERQRINDYRTRARVTDCLRAITDIFSGVVTVDEALAAAKIKCLSAHERGRLLAIYAKGKVDEANVGTDAVDSNGRSFGGRSQGRG